MFSKNCLKIIHKRLLKEIRIFGMDTDADFISAEGVHFSQVLILTISQRVIEEGHIPHARGMTLS